MVPQQGLDDGRSESPTSSGSPVFGSQLVDKNSATPYSDATQVGRFYLFFSVFPPSAPILIKITKLNRLKQSA